MNVTDFKPGEVVIYHYRQYSCETRDYTSAKKAVVILEISYNGVRIETERKQNPDYNLWIGSGCLDCLKKTHLQMI